MRRILVVTPYWPWRTPHGPSQRAAHLVSGLSAVGRVDLLALADGEDPQRGRDGSVGELYVIQLHEARSWLRRTLSRILGPESKWLLDRPRIRREAQRATVGRQYDLIVFVRAQSWVLLHSIFNTPAVVDIDDLSDVTLGRWRALGLNSDGEALRFGTALQIRFRLLFLRRQREAVKDAGLLVVSTQDRAAVRPSRAYVVPNAYPVGTSVGRVMLRDRGPVVLFVGVQTYLPNADAATWFAHKVLPLIREKVPRAEFRVVGVHDATLARKVSGTGVQLVGPVRDVQDQLDEARIVIAPLRVGAGSRIKILEAMAAGVPVVATGIGAEGIAARAGAEILLADAAEEFADACVTLLLDDTIADEIARRARAFVHYRHSPERVRGAVTLAAETELAMPADGG